MDADLIAALAEATVAGSAAMLLVLALRRPVRATLGASAAYALWLSVPAALLAVLLPRGVDVPLALPVAWQVAPAIIVSATPQQQSGVGWRELVMLLWLAGALASIAMLAWQQHRFRGALGTLRRRSDGLYQSMTATAGLPAVAGVLRPRILLPADFEQRYSTQEQSLVLQHERVHVRRGDLVANALGALLRCLFWFNPLLPLALRRFGLDQELACDERVIARNPRARRQYAEAMLKTHFDELPLPLGCHWQARHPIKERIDLLKRPTPSPMQWMAAMFLALGLSASAGYAAWAAQPAVRSVGAGQGDGGRYLLARQSSFGAQTGSGVLSQWVDAGEAAVSIIGAGAGQWKNTARIDPGPQPGTVTVRMTIEEGDPGRVVATPTLVVMEGDAAAVEQRNDDGALVYRTQFRVLPLVGSEQETQEKMDALLMGEPEAGTGDVEAATITHKMPPPHYPVEAARNYVDGEVMLLVTVAPDGSVSDVQVERSTPEGVFDGVSIAAARLWKFKPAMKDGRPIAGQVRVPITFSTAPENDQPSPVALSEFANYQWMRVPKDGEAASICDVVRADEVSDKLIFCGVRKAVVGR